MIHKDDAHTSYTKDTKLYESHLPTIMMTSHGHKQVQLVNKIFCLLFSYSVQFEILKHINATWKTS